MGHLLKIKCVDSKANVHIIASTSVSFTLITVHVPNLALVETKRITVWSVGTPQKCKVKLNFLCILQQELFLVYRLLKELGCTVFSGIPIKLVPSDKVDSRVEMFSS
jgi:hypothetical protein